MVKIRDEFGLDAVKEENTLRGKWEATKDTFRAEELEASKIMVVITNQLATIYNAAAFFFDVA